MQKRREAAFLNVFIATVPFLVFVLAKGFAGEAQLPYALSAPDDYMLSFGVAITVLAALTSSRRKVQVTPLFCQSVLLIIMSACGYVAMTDHVDNHVGLNLWFSGTVVVSMVAALFVAWQYLKVAL